MPINDIAAYANELHLRFEDADYGHPLRISEWHKHRPGFNLVREESGWHVLGEFPRHLIAVQYPHEDLTWFEWRKASYQPITRGPVQDTQKNITRLFTDTGFVAVNVPEDVQEYISEEKWEDMDLATWLNRVAFPVSCYDPNAVLVAMPYGAGVEDNDTAVEVKFTIIESRQLFDCKPNLISWKESKSLYWIVDDMWIYRVDVVDQNLVITEWYQHSVFEGYGAPAQVLGGMAQRYMSDTYYRSWFDAYFPFANECAKAYSTYQVVSAKHGFPIADVEPMPCEYVHHHEGEQIPCNNGMIYSRDGKIETCPNCGGAGKITANPGSIIFRKETPPDIASDPTPAIRYVEMPTSLKEMRENWEGLRDKGKEELSKRYVLEAQSGTAKEADREGEYNFLMSVAEWWFGTVVENCIFHVTRYRHRLDFPQYVPVVMPPKDFKIKSAADLIDELKEAKESGAPSGVLVETAREYAKKKYGRDMTRQKKLYLQLLLDPLAALSEDERQAKRFSGGADDRAMWINANAYTIIEQILESNPTAIDRDDIWWRAEFEKKVTEAMQAANPELAATLTGAIEGAMTQDAIDVEAEAKAKIRGSVGGVTGIIQIATAVAQGVLTEQAAESILVRIYGVTEDEAKAMIETAQQQPQ